MTHMGVLSQVCTCRTMCSVRTNGGFSCPDHFLSSLTGIELGEILSATATATHPGPLAADCSAPAVSSKQGVP